MSKWIDMRERLPFEDDCPIVVYYPMGGVHLRGRIAGLDDNFTHWMSIKPPKEYEKVVDVSRPV